MTEPTCAHPECERTRLLARGLCSKHYAQERRAGKHPTAACLWPSCGRAAITRGFCARDRDRAERVGDYTAPWLTWSDPRRRKRRSAPCRWPECDRIGNEGQGLCKLHWLRAHRLGDFEQPWTAWQTSVCRGCGKFFMGRNRIQKHCSDACAIEAWKRANPDRIRELGVRHASRRRALKLTTSVEDFTVTQVRLLYGDVCYLCGDRINFRLKHPHPGSPSLDHVIPLARGGTHTLDNVAMTHWRCNHKKNARETSARPAPTLLM